MPASSRAAGLEAIGIPEQLRAKPWSGAPPAGARRAGTSTAGDSGPPGRDGDRWCASQRAAGNPRFRQLWGPSEPGTLPSGPGRRSCRGQNASNSWRIDGLGPPGSDGAVPPGRHLSQHGAQANGRGTRWALLRAVAWIAERGKGRSGRGMDSGCQENVVDSRKAGSYR